MMIIGRETGCFILTKAACLFLETSKSSIYGFFSFFRCIHSFLHVYAALLPGQRDAFENYSQKLSVQN